jgi:hypothetical protein
MFSSMLRQEIGFHDLDENRSSILSTQLATSAPFCRGLSSVSFNINNQSRNIPSITKPFPSILQKRWEKFNAIGRK